MRCRHALPAALPAETAQAMARAAYRQAAKLSSFGTDIVGVGCTCALATDREKRGEHKAYITTYNGSQERRWAGCSGGAGAAGHGGHGALGRRLPPREGRSGGLRQGVGTPVLVTGSCLRGPLARPAHTHTCTPPSP